MRHTLKDLSRPVVDHRGERFTLCRAQNLPRSPRYALARYELGYAKTGQTIGCTFSVVLVSLMALVAALWTHNQGLLLLGAGAMTALLITAAGGRFMQSHRVKRAVEACSRYAICPCCGYDLQTISAQKDGCRVCPECGAAWRITPTDASKEQ